MTRTRHAAPADVADLRRIAAAAYRPYVARIGRPPAPMTADYAATVAAGRTWVAEDAGAVVGLLVLVPASGHMLLENVAVAPDAQGRGVGAALMRLAEDETRAAGLPEVRLYTNVKMTENLTYYPRLGYVETGRVHEDGFDRVYFSKFLNPP